MTSKIGDFPPLRVQALVGTREHATGHTGYHKEMQIIPKLIVEGTSTMAPIPAAEATMVVISMDTRAKYVEHKEIWKVTSVETSSSRPSAWVVDENSISPKHRSNSMAIVTRVMLAEKFTKLLSAGFAIQQPDR